jgi:hypothetical protein
MTPAEQAAIEKRARRGAARTGRPAETVREEMLAAREGRERGERFACVERYQAEWRERQRVTAARRRTLPAIIALAALAGPMPPLGTFR